MNPGFAALAVAVALSLIWLSLFAFSVVGG